MTYREILDFLQELDDEQLDFPAMAHVDEEFYGVKEINVQEKEDRLTDGHPYFEID
tara:strand:- start:794 stop:961 length:168 start_codon:yes stop_codon:yes gene_type:complete